MRRVLPVIIKYFDVIGIVKQYRDFIKKSIHIIFA